VKINPNDAAYRNLEALNLEGNPFMSDGNQSRNEMLLNLIKNCPYWDALVILLKTKISLTDQNQNLHSMCIF
jgi:hypothetical protein